ncbi:MAG: class I SAM-dependent methyltransferase [Planctomycetes bacterium]|nr:class I SAM-dependent methyltransferase [Planctomycetota bacterium]
MSSQPSPSLFFQTANAYQRTHAIVAAVQLDLFTAVGDGAQTVPELAERLQASERGMRILCDYLVCIGFLTKTGATYGLTQDAAAFLDRSSPSYLGGALEFLASPLLTEAFKDVAAAVRKGGTMLKDGGVMAPEHPIWVKFARAMAPAVAPQAALAAQLVVGGAKGPIRVLDVAAGHGLFGIEVARRHAEARVVALDWPGVLEVALENARKAGIEGRYETIPGSALEADLGSGYDAVLLPNILHHFDVPTCERLLGRVRAALAPRGKAFTVEFIPDEDRVSPPEVATFSMMMLGTTSGGDAYTFSELESMLRKAGFSRNELRPLPPSLQKAVISQP